MRKPAKKPETETLRTRVIASIPVAEFLPAHADAPGSIADTASHSRPLARERSRSRSASPSGSSD